MGLYLFNSTEEEEAQIRGVLMLLEGRDQGPCHVR